jgi:2-polyprenyl-6-methoxyphenol hydroxylase-like FAD-dependent oxidoreductase
MPSHPWEAIYLTLRATFPDDRYHMGAAVTDITPEAGRAVAAVTGPQRLESDILIAADGANSALRHQLVPDAVPHYAGYVAWRGTLDQADAPERLVSFLDDAFTFCEARSGGHMLVYFIPGDGADAAPGRRRLNWVWYVRAEDQDLSRKGYYCRSRAWLRDLHGQLFPGIPAALAGLPSAACSSRSAKPTKSNFPNSKQVSI